MVQSLELLLEPVADAVVRDQWGRLAAAHLPSQARHTGASNRPHITLDARDRAGDDDRLAEGLPVPVTLRIGGPLLFAVRRGWVLARHVVVDDELLRLHRRVHDLLGPGTSPLTGPGRWVPHVTLAHGLGADQVGAALGIVGADPPLESCSQVVRRWDSEAVRTWDV